VSAVSEFAYAFGIFGGDIPPPGPWAEDGRCRRLGPKVLNAFFPGRGDDLEPARGVCKPCPVKDQCLAYALAHPNLVGVWAGTSHRQREQLREERTLAAERSAAKAEAAEGRPRNSPRGTVYAWLEAVAAAAQEGFAVAHFEGEHSAPAMASNLRSGGLARPSGQWEFVGRKSDAGGSDLYVRYLGA
jgi:WhiB family redox-sensing transcriptional regulator